MKNKTYQLFPGTIAAGFILGLSAIHSSAAITLTTASGGSNGSSNTASISIDGSGTASTATAGFAAAGSVTPTLAFGTSLTVTIDAVGIVNTTVGANFGAKSTNGNISRAASGAYGVTGGTFTTPNNGIQLLEGLLVGIDATSLDSSLDWQLTAIRFVLVDANEQFTVVNRNNTSLSLTSTTGSSADTWINVSSLGIKVTGGTSDLDAASVFMSGGLTVTDGNNFRISGFEFDAVPEPSSTALVGLGLCSLALRRRRRAC